MKKNIFLLQLLIISGLMLSCSDEDKKDDIQTAEVKTVVLENVTETEWIYYSFQTGNVIGRSELLNLDDDSKWMKRDDWDFAICGSMIRTNSGTSGEGQGGIIEDKNRSFHAVEVAPNDGYIIDTNETIVKN